MKIAQDSPVPTRLKLSAPIMATMFCFACGDQFGLYVPSKLASVTPARMRPIGPATPGTLVAVSMMAVPSLLIASALIVATAVSRWRNIPFGVFRPAVIAITTPGAKPFYITLAIIEMLLTASIVLVAWAWATIEGDGK